jgi:hypothetical protein
MCAFGCNVTTSRPSEHGRRHTAASGRYIRCSKITSLIGMKLDVGSNIAKKATPRNPTAGRRVQAHIVHTTRIATTDAGTAACAIN